jgi:membrane protease YdiL (CAAX protease family)
MRGIFNSIGKILGFLGLWALLLGGVTMAAVIVGGEHWFADVGWRLWLEAGGAAAALIALAVMALWADKRGLGTIGLKLDASLLGLPLGVLLGAAIFAAPLGMLAALGAARFVPDWSSFTFEALGLGLVLCLFNVIHQEILMRSYIFQELWRNYSAAIAITVTTLFSLLLHAAPLLQGVHGLIAGANIAIAGGMLGLAYARSGALWLPIGIHLGWNGLQGPVLNINVTGAEIGLGQWRVFEFSGDALLTGGAMGVEGGLVGLIGPALGLTIVALCVPATRER